MEKFRAAPLRDVALTAPSFHSGAVWSLSEAEQIMGDPQLGANLDAGEMEAILAFLRPLAGEQPEVVLSTLPRRQGGTPRPSAF